MKQSPSSGGMNQSPSSGARSVKESPSAGALSVALPESTARLANPVQRAQRTALALFALTLAMVALTVVQLSQSGQGQIWIVLVGLVIYAIATLVAWQQFGMGQSERGGWILLGGMFVIFPLSAFLTEGTGLAFALCLITLTILVAPLTLSATSATRAVGIAIAISVLTLIVNLIEIRGRAQVPYANAVMPFVTVGLVVVLVVFIVRSFPSFSLRNKLIVVSLAVALLPLALIGVFFASSSQQNAIASANQALLGAARETSNNVDAFIQNSLNDIRVASQVPELVDLLKSPNRENTDYAKAEAQAAIILRSLRRRDPIYLRSYALLDKTGSNLLDTSRNDIGLDEASRSYFVGPVATNLPYVSPVTTDPNTGQPSIYFSAPIRDESGELLGVLRARYDARILQEFLFGDNGLAGSASGAILLDEQNIKLADGRQPDNVFKIVGQPLPDQINALKAQRRLPDLPLEEIVINSPELKLGLANAAQQPTFEMDLGNNVGKEQVAVGALTAAPWKVVFSRAQTEFLGPVNQQARAILLAGLLIVLAVAGVAVLAAQVIARPVISLTETAQKVRQGDMNAQAQITTQDEIGVLALTFNGMTAQLRDMVITLEDRVQRRTSQLRASAEVGRAATSILDPDLLAEQVATLITTRFDFYYAAVFILDPEGQRAVLRAATGEAGRTLLDRHHQLPVTSESMVGTAIITRRPRIALDVGQGTERFANPLLPTTRSEIALPLRVGDRVLGALDVQSEQINAFDEANAEVLQSMADQIAVALFNAETFRRSERQAQDLARLNQLNRELAQAASREEAAWITAQAIINLIGPSRVALVETTANPQMLALREVSFDETRPLGAPFALSALNSLSGESLKQNILIYVSDLSTVADKYEDTALVYPLGVRSSVAFPLRSGEHTIGTLNVGHEQVNAFTTEQIGQLEQVAAQVALTLESLNLAKQTQQALAELDTANRRLVGEAWSTYAETGGLVSAEWRNGEWNTAHQHQRRSVTLGTQALVSAPHAINLPIKVRGETIGEFSVITPKAQADWNADDVAFAQSLIDQVGQVIETARLLEETERTARREKAVADAADKIHRSTDIETVLHSAITELNRITGQSGISIQLGFGPTAQAEGRSQPASAEGDR